MITRKASILTLVGILLLTGISVPTQIISLPQADALTSGEINGITYSYGEQQFSTTVNVTYEDSGFISESYQESFTGVMDMPLIKDYSLVDIYYRINGFVTNSSGTYRIEWGANTTTYSQLLQQIAAAADPGWTYNNQSGIATADVYDQSWNYLGQFPVNTTLITYTVYAQDVTLNVIPAVVVVSPVYEMVQVYYNRTRVSASYVQYYNRYSAEYNISASAYQVNMTNGDNFAMAVTMFDRIDADYLEVAVTAVNYAFAFYDFTDIQFTNDGATGNNTHVWEAGYGIPFDLMPRVYRTNGSILEWGFSYIHSSVVSTYQNVVAAFATATANATDSELTLEQRLAIWGLSTSTTLVAFKDRNNNGQLDVGLDDNGLYVDSTDRVEALGLAEAYSTSIRSHYNHTEVYDEHAEYANFKDDKVGVRETFNGTVIQDSGVGNARTSQTFSSFTFDTPVAHDNGEVEFNFGVQYTNFPVTWINLLTNTNRTDAENIGYHYKVLVNPETGQAKLSTTFTYGGVTDTAFKSIVNGLSLALLVKSEFFTAQGVYTANLDTSANTSSARTSTFARLGARIGGQDATNITADGPKQYYTLGGSTTHTAGFSALRLVTVAGTFQAERVSPFASESENAAGGTVTGTLTERLTVNVFYAADLIIVTYPQWSGNSIVHDPDYSIQYQANPTPPPDTNTLPPDTNTNTDTGSNTPDAPKDTGNLSLPGFLFPLSFIAILSGAVFTSRRRKS